MTVWQESLSGRALAGAERGFGPAWRASVSGRVLTRGSRVGARRLAAGSLLPLAGERSLSTADAGFVLSDGAPSDMGVCHRDPPVSARVGSGRTARRCARGVARFRRRGHGRVASPGRSRGGDRPRSGGPDRGRRAGRRHVGARDHVGSGVGRGRPAGACGAPEGRNLDAVFGIVAAAAFGVGVLAGASAGVTPIAAVVVALACSAVVVLPYRAELLLLLLAAFPWVDFLARRSLGGLSGAWDEMFLLGSFACLAWVVFVVRRWDFRTLPILLPLCVAVVAAIGSVTLRDVPQTVGIFALRVTFQPLLFYFSGLSAAARQADRALGGGRLPGGLVAPGRARALPVRDRCADARLVGGRPREDDRHACLLDHRESQRARGVPPAGNASRSRPGSATDRHERAPGSGRRRRRAGRRYRGHLQPGGVARPRGGSRGADRLSAVGGYWWALPWRGPPFCWYRRRCSSSGWSLLSARPTWPRARRPVGSTSGGWPPTVSWRTPGPAWGLECSAERSAFLFGWSRLWIDNFYLQLAAEGGLVLLGAFLWLLVRAGKGLLAAYVDQADPYLRGVAAGVFGGFVAVAFANLTASVWETVAVGSGFWFLVGLASAPLEAESRLPRAGRLIIEARDGQPVGEAPSAELSPSGRAVSAERG